MTKAKPQRRTSAKPSKPKPNASVGSESQSTELVENSVSSCATAETVPNQGTPGRPPGAKNVKRDEVDVQVPRCKVCKSTRRSAYGHPVVQIAAGTDVNDQPFTHVVARPTKCLDCGQARRDISYENHPNLSADELLNRLVKKRRK